SPDGQVHIHLPEELIFIQADPILIEQSLFNLIENAFRHGENDLPLKLNVYQEKEQTDFEIANHGEIPLKEFQKNETKLSDTN
ncbi:hypothetical protein, partial [Enterococcus faecalis]|uniref:hypothetical protein n=1 Tax=Enterococcus faecalis TaxID=1351 RepID=UPI003D6B2A16